MTNLFYVTLLGLLISSPLTAADLDKSFQPRGPAPFTAYDTNQDGTISPQELTAFRNHRQTECIRASRAQGLNAKPSFEDIDKNGDGAISQMELSEHQQHQMSQKQAQKGPKGAYPGGQGRGRNMPTFREFDLNGDGSMTEQEFLEARDSRIAERAKQGYMMRGLANIKSFSEIDTNADGLVNQGEFLNMQEQHRQSRVK